jgi:hypothetical protein
MKVHNECAGAGARVVVPVAGRSRRKGGNSSAAAKNVLRRLGGSVVVAAGLGVPVQD